MAPLWHGYVPPVSTLVSLDSGPKTWVNLDYPEGAANTVAASAIRWGASGLTNGLHTVTISLGFNAEGQNATWGEVDAFM